MSDAIVMTTWALLKTKKQTNKEKEKKLCFIWSKWKWSIESLLQHQYAPLYQSVYWIIIDFIHNDLYLTIQNKLIWQETGVTRDWARRVQRNTKYYFAPPHTTPTHKTVKPVLHGDMCIACSIKIWWMTFLVTQHTRGLSPFPSRRSTKMYAKAINIPDKCPWRVPLAWENSPCSISRQFGWVKGLTIWHRKIPDLHEGFSATFLAKCLRVNRA